MCHHKITLVSRKNHSGSEKDGQEAGSLFGQENIFQKVVRIWASMRLDTKVGTRSVTLRKKMLSQETIFGSKTIKAT